MNVNFLPAKQDILPGKKRVAAYARVSGDKDASLHSLSAQVVAFYSGLIQRNNEWEYAGVYADEGISGTSTKHRVGFNEMIEDALAGKIDLIVTKFISRFARNTIDTLTTVRQLKEKYKGDALLQKKYTVDFLSKKQK